MEVNINKKEVRRYLGYKIEDTQVEVLIDECIEEIKKVANPRFVYEIMPLTVTEEIVDMGFLSVTSKNLSKNLRGCQKVAIMATTLGIEVDRWINRYSRIYMAKAVVMQAVAVTLIEAWCDSCQVQIEEEASQMGLFLRPRFSPGYGDFPLESQNAILQLLQAQKKIGLTVTDSLLLVPIKSVTAVIGLSEYNSRCEKNGCEVCKKENCAYRR